MKYLERLPPIIRYPLYAVGMWVGANLIAMSLIPIILAGAALLAIAVVLSAITG